MKYRLMISMFSFVLFTLSASPALAGQVTIVNNTQNWNCYVQATGYFMSIPTQMDTTCALPGRTEGFHTSLSVGHIAAHCAYNGTSANPQGCTSFDTNYQDHQVQSKHFPISGTWLPHRNFTVTVTGNAVIKGWGTGLNFELTEN